MKKGMILAMIMIIAATGIVTAAGQKESATDEKTFSFIVKDMTNPYFLRMQEGAVKAAEEFDIDLSWTAAQFNGDIEGQIALVEAQLARDPDALILVPMNASALCPKVKEANSLEVPVINTDTRLETSGCGDAVTFVGLDEKETGILLASFVVDYFDGNATIAILEGFRGSSTAEERLVGFNEVFASEPGMVVVATQTAEWDREKGMNVTADIMQNNPDLTLVVASNDEMALGAIQAVKSAGKMDQIQVVGIDAVPAALQSIKNGEMLATIDGNTDLMGYESVKTAYEYVVNGKRDIPTWIKVPATVILSDDITDQYLRSRGIELD